jgi:hypothetical protein
MLRSDRGGVCAGDGWPVEFWDAFTSVIDHLPPGTISEKLGSFRDSGLQERNPAVAEWRAVLRGGSVRPSNEPSEIGGGWVPVPATLVDTTGTTACIVSWDPKGPAFRSLSDALDSPEAHRAHPDRLSQARYYLECTLGKLHGVRFGPHDAIEDERFAHSPEVLGLEDSLKGLEQERVSDPRRGALDRFG